VAVIGGSARITGIAKRLATELNLLEPGGAFVTGVGGTAQAKRVLPITPEAAWGGGALVGAAWDPEIDLPAAETDFEHTGSPHWDYAATNPRRPPPAAPPPSSKETPSS
jgi:hypothetical protein